MRIGIDVDGPIADFCTGMIRLLREEGVIIPEACDTFPSEWNFADAYGTNEQVNRVWQRIMDPNEFFWYSLSPRASIEDLDALKDAVINHQVYFITSRVGEAAKEHTEGWLSGWIDSPTVLIGDSPVAKGHLVRGLSLDCFLDDGVDNVRMAEFFGRPCGTKVFLCTHSINRDYKCSEKIRRVSGVKEMMEIMEGDK